MHWFFKAKKQNYKKYFIFALCKIFYLYFWCNARRFTKYYLLIRLLPNYNEKIYNFHNNKN